MKYGMKFDHLSFLDELMAIALKHEPKNIDTLIRLEQTLEKDTSQIEEYLHKIHLSRPTE